MVAHPPNLWDATTWLAALWLTGDSSTSQRRDQCLLVYWIWFTEKPGPNVISNCALKHLPLSVISFLIRLVNTVFWMQYFPPAWKHAGVTSTLKPEKDSGLTSFQSVILLGTNGKLFDKILLTRILSEVSWRLFLRNKRFGFRPKHSTALQIIRLVEKFPGTWMRRGSQARFSRMWLRHSILHGSTDSSTS